jgi:hypothetical protein
MTMYNQQTYTQIVQRNENPSSNMQLVEESYRGFRLVRENPAFNFWLIRTTEDEAPPIDLLGRWTNVKRAKQSIDEHLHRLKETQ